MLLNFNSSLTIIDTIIHFILVRLVVISLFILDLSNLSHLFFSPYELTKGLTILLSFSNNKVTVSLIFSIIFCILYFINFWSTLSHNHCEMK